MATTTSGFSYFLQGLSLIFKPGVKRFVAIPIIINVLLFIIAIVVAGNFVEGLIDKYLPEDTYAWLKTVLIIFFYLISLIVVFFTFSIVVNIIGAPFNGYLAAAVEKHLTGKEPPGSHRHFMAEFGVLVLSEAKKWLYFLMIAIPLGIVSIILFFIPVVNVLIPVIWFIFGAWMFSLEYSDYPMGNYGLTFSEIRKEIAKKRMMSLGFGSAVTLGTMLPLFNFIVMPVAVAGATLMRVEQFPIQAK
ncbi:MAG: sulfate transporter CysZ [Thioalkalispiraceae bacterium]|jgi:CysZ protein